MGGYPSFFMKQPVNKDWLSAWCAIMKETLIVGSNLLTCWRLNNLLQLCIAILNQVDPKYQNFIFLHLFVRVTVDQVKKSFLANNRSFLSFCWDSNSPAMQIRTGNPLSAWLPFDGFANGHLPVVPKSTNGASQESRWSWVVFLSDK